MTSGPYDPFAYERRQRRLLDDAMGGSATRFMREEQDRIRRMRELGVPAAAKTALDEYRERERFLQEAGIANSVQDLVAQQRERYREMEAPLKVAMEHFEIGNSALAKRVEVGSLSAAKAFQEQIAGVMTTTIQPFADVVKQLREADVFTRIAEQQAELVKIGNGLSSQLESVRTAMQGAFPAATEVSAALSMQSAISENLKRFSEQIGSVNVAAFAGVRDSELWASLRDHYEFEEEISVPQALARIGDQLQETEGEPKRLSAKQIWDLIQVLFMIYSVYLIWTGHGYSPEDRARDDRDSASLERIEAGQIEKNKRDLEELIAEASALAELRRIEALPQAYVLNTANIRTEPAQKSERVERLGPNARLAIEERQGRWFRVVFNHPITGEYREGWVWHSSVELIAEAPE